MPPYYPPQVASVPDDYQQTSIPIPKRKKYYLSIHTKYKDELPYLKEWIDFHLLVGVEHFYMYDEMSNDQNRQKILQPYIDRGIVTHIVWKSRDFRKDRVNFIANYGHDSNWVAFIDIDEFLFSPQINHNEDVPLRKLSDILTDYESFPAVVVNWVMYGTNFQKEYQPSPVIERFFLRDKLPTTVIKTILQPDQVNLTELGKYNHSYTYHENRLAVNEDKHYVYQNNNIPYQTANIFRINHYRSKSHQEMKDKIQKMKKRDYHCKESAQCYEYSYRYSNHNEVDDKILWQYIPLLKSQSIQQHPK